MDDLADVQGRQVPLKGSSWDTLMRGYSKNPQATALTVCGKPEEHYRELTIPGNNEDLEPDERGCLSWSYKQLLVACQRVSKFLLNHGIKRGSNMLLFVSNDVEWPLMLWVAMNLQLTFVPSDFRTLTETQKDDILYLIGIVKPDLVVTDCLCRATILEDILIGSGHTHVRKLTFSKPKPSDQWLGYNDIIKANLYPDGSVGTNELPQAAALDDDGNRVQYVFFTSGTSAGRPKGCPGRVDMVRNLVLTDFGAPLPERATHAPRMLMLVSGFRVISLANAMRVWRHGGNTVFPSAQIDWSAVLSSMQIQQAMYDSLHNIPRPIGGNIVTLGTIAATQKIFPNANVRVGHGMTEGGGVFELKPDASEPGSGPPRSWCNIVTLGRAGPNTEIRILDAMGQVVKRNEVGDLHISSPGLVTSYIDNVLPELHYTADGRVWFVTGDRAVVDKQGLIFIVGRSKDDIKMNAFSLSPSIPEAILNKHEGIEAVVVGVPHNLYGNSPVAVVKDGPSVSAERIMRLVEEGCGPDYTLSAVWFLSELGFESWPKNDNGKGTKKDVRDAVLRVMFRLLNAESDLVPRQIEP